LLGQSALMDEVHSMLRAAGKTDLVLPSAELLAAASLPRFSPARDRRLRRWAYGFMLLNVAVVSSALGAMALVRQNSMPLVSAISLLVTLVSAPAFLYLVFDQTVGRLFPVLRRNGGERLLALALIPWLTGIALVLIVVLAGLSASRGPRSGGPRPLPRSR